MKEINMSKQALSITLETLKSRPIEWWDTFMEDRSVCDSVENPNPEHLQIVTYCLFIVPNADGLKSKLLTYTRPTGGNESRLHGEYSIGIGGHIDSEVTTDLFTLLVNEARREIKEELGYDVPYKNASASMMDAFRTNRIIYNPEDPVSTVHVGIVPVFVITEEVFASFKPKADEVLDLRLVELGEFSNMPDISTLDSPDDFGNIVQGNMIDKEALGKFESWSKAILTADLVNTHTERMQAAMKNMMQSIQEQAAQEAKNEDIAAPAPTLSEGMPAQDEAAQEAATE